MKTDRKLLRRKRKNSFQKCGWCTTTAINIFPRCLKKESSMMKLTVSISLTLCDNVSGEKGKFFRGEQKEPSMYHVYGGKIRRESSPCSNTKKESFSTFFFFFFYTPYNFFLCALLFSFFLPYTHCVAAEAAFVRGSTRVVWIREV
jgi:hypothetical protein